MPFFGAKSRKRSARKADAEKTAIPALPQPGSESSQADGSRTPVERHVAATPDTPDAIGVSAWADHASRHLHWHSPEHHAWISRCTEPDDGKWRGWSALDGAPVQAMNITPWTSVCDTRETPYVRWFCRAQTSAAFNELDRHHLQVSDRATSVGGIQRVGLCMGAVV